MRFSINSKKMLDLLLRACSPIPARVVSPVDQNIRLSLHDGALEASGFGMDCIVNAKTSVASYIEEGTVYFNPARMVELLKLVSDYPFALQEQDGLIQVECVDGSYTMMGQTSFYSPKEDDSAVLNKFDASMPDEEEPVFTIEISAGNFLSALGNVSFAMGKDDFHPQFMGVFVEVQNEELRLVATDTRVLAIQPIREAKIAGTGSVIIPDFALSIMRRAIDPKKDLTILVGNQNVYVTSDGLKLRFPKVKGNFPPYRRVIPNGPWQTAVMDAKDLMRTLSTVNFVFTSASSLTKLSFEPMTLTVSSQGENNSGRTSMRCACSVPEFKMGADANLLKGVINFLGAKEVKMSFMDSNRPMLFHDASEEDEANGDLRKMCLFMPMFIQD